VHSVKTRRLYHCQVSILQEYDTASLSNLLPTVRDYYIKTNSPSRKVGNDYRVTRLDIPQG
jgi:hypothetical protein